MNASWCFLFWRGTLGSCVAWIHVHEKSRWVWFACASEFLQRVPKPIEYITAVRRLWGVCLSFLDELWKTVPLTVDVLEIWGVGRNYTKPYILFHFDGFRNFLINGQLTGLSGCGQWSSRSLLSTSTNLEAPSTCTSKWAVLFSCDWVPLLARLPP